MLQLLTCLFLFLLLLYVNILSVFIITIFIIVHYFVFLVHLLILSLYTVFSLALWAWRWSQDSLRLELFAFFGILLPEQLLNMWPKMTIFSSSVSFWCHWTLQTLVLHQIHNGTVYCVVILCCKIAGLALDWFMVACLHLFVGDCCWCSRKVLERLS